jgi:hypothetical protein
VRRSLQGAALAGLVLLGNAAYVIAALGPLHRSKTVLETDHRTYMEMAWAEPWRAEVEAPYCWRLLTPYLVFLIIKSGLDMNAAYYLLTNLALFGFLFCLHAYLARLGLSAGESALGLLLVGLLPAAVRWYQYQYWMTDPLALFFVTLGLLLVHSERHVWLAVLGTVALANRETHLLVLVYFALDRLRREPARTALPRALLIALPGLAVLAAIRYLLLPRPGEDVLATLGEMLAFRYRHLFDNQLYLVTLGSFGVLLPLALLEPRRVAGELRRHYEAAAYLALTFASLALANNTDRLLVYAAPVLLPPALWGLRSLTRRGLATVWIALVLALQAFFYRETLFYGHQGISIYQPTNWPVILSMLGFYVLARWRLRRADAAA